MLYALLQGMTLPLVLRISNNLNTARVELAGLLISVIGGAIVYNNQLIIVI